MGKGVFYIATDEGFAREADISAQSVKKECDGLSTTIITDKNYDLDYIDNIIITDETDMGFKSQPYHMMKSPYERTLYIDTDTYICSDIRDVFDILDNFDIAATHSPSRVKSDFDSVPTSFPEFNTGVVLFDSDITDTFFKSWLNNYSDDHKHGQPSFRKTIYEGNYRIATLTREYNVRLNSPGYVYNDAKIIHSRLLDIDSPGGSKPRGCEVNKVADILNKKTGEKRVYFVRSNFKVITRSEMYPLRKNATKLWERTINSIRNEGVVYTSRRAIEMIINNVRK